MNVLKNYSELYQLNRYFLPVLVLMLISVDLNAAESLSSTSNSIGYAYYLKAILGLAFVIVLFLVSTFLFKRFGNGPMLGQGQLRIVDGLHLGNRERLMLVEINNKQILLAITPGKISKLDTLDKDITEKASESKFEVVASNNSSGQPD